MSVRILKPGWLTTVQDLGRTGLQKYGIGVGGAMDGFAARAANRLVGNPEQTALLELTLPGAVLQWERDAVVAVCGADLGAVYRPGEYWDGGEESSDKAERPDKQPGECQNEADECPDKQPGVLPNEAGERSDEAGVHRNEAGECPDTAGVRRNETGERSDKLGVRRNGVKESPDMAGASPNNAGERSGGRQVLLAAHSPEPLPVPLWRTIRVKAGTIFHFRETVSGCRAYLAVAGGIAAAAVMGSRSTDLRGRFGGWQGRALRTGDRLAFGRPADGVRHWAAQAAIRPDERSGCHSASWTVSALMRPDYAEHPELRIVWGRDAHRFARESRERFLQEAYVVTPQSDRMGYRLQGSPLQREDAGEMLSEAVTAGSVQVPPNGQPVILGADRQTTGGYPLLAQVAAVDLPVLAQVRPGGRIRFRAIPLEEAQRLWLFRERELEMLAAGLADKWKGGARHAH